MVKDLIIRSSSAEFELYKSDFDLLLEEVESRRVKTMSNNLNINWYPGHMAKTKKQIIEDLKLIDIVIEILDARIPLASQNPDIENCIKDKIK